VLTDAAGDASPFVQVLDADVLDLLAVSVDSDGTALSVTFTVGDLDPAQPQAEYDLDFMLATATQTLHEAVNCQVGSHKTGLAENECFFVADTPPWLSDPPGTVVDTVLQRAVTQVPAVVDYAANTVTATVPYALMGGTAGDVADRWYAQSCEGYFVVGVCSADVTSPRGGTPHTLG
jgi:hypothetical protein